MVFITEKDMAFMTEKERAFIIEKTNEYVNKIKFYDTEHDCVITIGQLKAEYDDLKRDPKTKAEYENVSFVEFIKNCMVENNGTLEFI